MPDRATSFAGVLADQPAFRRKQCLEAMFASGFSAWKDVVVLPKALRERLAIEVSWMTVKEKRVLRDLITASAEIAESAFDPGEDVEAVIDQIEQKIFPQAFPIQAICFPLSLPVRQ